MHVYFFDDTDKHKITKYVTFYVQQKAICAHSLHVNILIFPTRDA